MFLKQIQIGACAALLSIVPAVFAAAPMIYSPVGPIPESLKPGETPLWNDDDVNAVVDVSYVTVDAIESASQYGAPAACDKVGFLRFKVKGTSDNAADADANLMMVPGILEGANGFDYIGRQVVYIAKMQYGKNFEVWAMDRRANCLEDLTGMSAARQASTVAQAEDTLIGYYYQQQPVNDKTFAGFLNSQQLPFLYYFGFRQATLDMYAIIKHMVPDPAVSKRKVFVGGHSLGGTHVSAFLSWDFDGNPATTDDAGYKLVAGAFGLDTWILPPSQGPFVQQAKQWIAKLSPAGYPQALADGEVGYRHELMALKTGKLPREVYVPGVFGPEVIALPQGLGLLANMAPDAESDVLHKIPIDAELNGLLKVMHSRNLYNATHPPFITDFRYTNQALVGLIFDDNYSELAFLQAGLGFLHGGPVVPKQKKIEWLASTPSGAGLQGIIGSQPHYIAADAGPDLDHLGTGPLYSWARRDQLGTLDDPDYLSLNHLVQFSYLQNEPSDIRDFAVALDDGPTNFTEWYFPTRIFLDSFVIGNDWVTKYGLDLYYADGVEQVPSLVIDGDQGITGAKVGDPPPFPSQTLIVAPGFTHIDPMFAKVNSPSQIDYVEHPLIEFALAHVK